jgi:hypothetical protein
MQLAALPLHRYRAVARRHGGLQLRCRVAARSSAARASRGATLRHTQLAHRVSDAAAAAREWQLTQDHERRNEGAAGAGVCVQNQRTQNIAGTDQIRPHSRRQACSAQHCARADDARGAQASGLRCAPRIAQRNRSQEMQLLERVCSNRAFAMRPPLPRGGAPFSGRTPRALAPFAAASRACCCAACAAARHARPSSARRLQRRRRACISCGPSASCSSLPRPRRCARRRAAPARGATAAPARCACARWCPSRRCAAEVRSCVAPLRIERPAPHTAADARPPRAPRAAPPPHPSRVRAHASCAGARVQRTAHTTC